MKTMQQIDAEYKSEMNRARLEGRLEGGQEIILGLLTRRCGNVSTDIQVRVQALPQVRLKELSVALLDFTSLADLEAWLNQD
jgi:Domain of unknown function (DUF4351)